MWVIWVRESNLNFFERKVFSDPSSPAIPWKSCCISSNYGFAMQGRLQLYIEYMTSVDGAAAHTAAGFDLFSLPLL